LPELSRRERDSFRQEMLAAVERAIRTTAILTHRSDAMKERGLMAVQRRVFR
jgi:hypothetical protein